MKVNILIIDNQFLDYQVIYDGLKLTGHKIYPADEAEFMKVMDYVRIFLLGEVYDEVRVSKAKAELNYYIKDKKIDLLLVDYKLSGSVLGETGIELVMELTHAAEPKRLHYIFLTRTPKNLENVKKRLSNLKDVDLEKVEWIDKGFGGFRMSEPAFFKDYILDRIPEIFSDTEVEVFLSHLEGFIKLDIVPSAQDKLKRMKIYVTEHNIVPDPFKELISFCIDPDNQVWAIEKKLKDFEL